MKGPKKIKRIALIGAGNMATHLFSSLTGKVEIVQVYSRHIENARVLAAKSPDCAAICDIADIDRTVDMAIVAVSDSAIQEVADKLSKVLGEKTDKCVVVHTSGTTTATIAGKKMSVLYPLQTFTKGVALDMKTVPFFIAADTEADTRAIRSIASLMSENILYIEREKLPKLHLAAVFACNFANRTWAIAEEILHDAGFDFSVMENIVRTTLDKALAVGAREGQTGPARRNDDNTINYHLAMLEGENAHIYSLLTQSIINEYNNDDKNNNG